MKKILFCFAVLIICSSLFGLSITYDKEIHDYDSVPMLEVHFGNGEGRTSDYYDSMKISLVTFAKDDPLYSWFGHAGLVVEKEDSAAVMYDWGLFCFGPEFYKNFAKGILWYSCGRTYTDNEYIPAIEAKRSIRKIELNLTSEQKRDIINYVNLNCSSEYCDYMYNLFTDNCSTRIRDIINMATNGRFEVWAKTKPGYTYRQQLSKTLINVIPMNWLYDYLFGPMGDRKATLWEEMFLPVNLADAVSEFENLAAKDYYEYDFRENNGRKPDAEQPESYFLYTLVFGMIMALASSLFYPKHIGLYKIQAFTFNLFLGLFGALLFYLMIFTNHDFAFFNENILFINPLLLISAFLSLNPKKHRNGLKIIYSILLILSVILVVCKIGISNVFYQNNYSQMVSVIPFYVANIMLLNKE